MRNNHFDHNFNPRHLLSKGALARLTNSDGLTAEVNLIIKMKIVIMKTLINIKSFIMMMVTR